MAGNRFKATMEKNYPQEGISIVRNPNIENNIDNNIKEENKSENVESNVNINDNSENIENKINNFENNVNLDNDSKNKENNIKEENKSENVENNVKIENKSSKKDIVKDKSSNNAKKKVKILEEKSIVKDKLGLGVRIDILKEIEEINKAYKKSGIKSNASIVIEKALATIYNKEKNVFDIDIDKKADLKTTTFHIDKKYVTAIEVLAESSNVSKSEIFDLLIRNGIENLYE